ncbi:MAG: hypothetical protein RBT76_00245 [candidate division Zixibacteria bacterium]|jgi:glycosyltransferase involved in cell wall biosynthesis|nr:hypothetical protein [candidate division Zixibacteria bacterium]
MSRRVMVVCYYFPPLGLGGVGRPLNLYKYLPGHGWDCDILTVRSVAYRAYEPELLHGVRTDGIFRSGSYDPQRMLCLLGIRTLKHSTIRRGRPVSDRFFPDSKVGWVRPAVRLGTRLMRRRKYNAIISTSPPISSHLVAMELAKQHSLPWIADFRDFWTMYKIDESYADARNKGRAHELKESIVRTCSRITAVNPAITDYLGQGEVITNGFDIDRAEQWKPPADSTSFVIGIPGTFNEERVVEPLLAVVEAVKQRRPDLYDRIRFVQVGLVEPQWLGAMFESHGLRTRVEIHGLQKRDRTIEIFSQCHLFYLGLTAEREQGILPQRMFDMAASGRPVLASASADSEICRFIRLTGAGFCFTERDRDRAAGYLTDTIERAIRGELAITRLPDYALPYSSDAMACSFAKLLDALT